MGRTPTTLNAQHGYLREGYQRKSSLNCRQPSSVQPQGLNLNQFNDEELPAYRAIDEKKKKKRIDWLREMALEIQQ